MNTATDIQLKHALAKMLPGKVYMNTNGGQRYHRLDGEPQPKVLDTELLHLCWLVEETLTRMECTNYSDALLTQHPEIATKADEFFWHFNWQQRTIALSRTLDIKIV